MMTDADIIIYNFSSGQYMMYGHKIKEILQDDPQN